MSVFENEKIEVFVDGTLGVGGHSKAILDHHPEIKLHIGIDKDEEALEEAKKTLWDYQEKLDLVYGDFKDLREHLSRMGVRRVQGILLDIGVSSIQLDDAQRGFSFLKEGPLDMRMDSRAPLSAEQIVNTYTKEELARIFWEYGEERGSRKIADVICQKRQSEPFTTTRQLAACIEEIIPRSGKIHPATRVFQALRIAVNGELSALEKVLEDILEVLDPGGIACIISFHSLEDRIVKQFIQKHLGRMAYGVRGEKRLEAWTKKPIVPTSEETRQNPRARSAKLRAFRKVG